MAKARATKVLRRHAWNDELTATGGSQMLATRNRGERHAVISEVRRGSPISQSECDLFVKTSIPGHSLHHLLPPYRGSNFRERGHSFHLSDYDTVLFKKSFIVHSSYKFVTHN